MQVHDTGSEAAARVSSTLGRVFDEHEAAASMKLSVHTLRAWRRARRGPVFRKLGVRVVYTERDLEDYLKAVAVPTFNRDPE
jgi:hypothetical protein